GRLAAQPRRGLHRRPLPARRRPVPPAGLPAVLRRRRTAQQPGQRGVRGTAVNTRPPQAIWYWPGVRRRPDELSVLLGGLAGPGRPVTRLCPPYDQGPPPWHPGSPLRALLDGAGVD